MKINEKIRFIRELKSWSQEEMAEKLNMSVGGYANIERGETDIQFSRLEQIAEILGIKLSNLTDLDEKNLRIFLAVHNHDNIENQITFPSSDTELQHQLEKAHLTIEQQQKEILLLKQQNDDLREMLGFLRKEKT